MDLRRKTPPFSGFTPEEVQRMEQFLSDSSEQHLKDGFCKNLSRVFNRSSGRAGKPAVRWTEIYNWFEKNKDSWPVKATPVDAGEKSHAYPESVNETRPKDAIVALAQGKVGSGSTLEFEAKSSVNGAWYDVDTFLSHRFLKSGEIEVQVSYVGFGREHNEWVNVKDSVRERSVHLDDSQCHKVRLGDLVVCFQEDQSQSTYYDCHVVDVERRLHDIRGCRCLFKIKYDHDDTEEKVRLRRLCCRPNML